MSLILRAGLVAGIALLVFTGVDVRAAQQLYSVKVGHKTVLAYPMQHGDYRDCDNHVIRRAKISGTPKPSTKKCPHHPSHVVPHVTAIPTPTPPPLPPTPPPTPNLHFILPTSTPSASPSPTPMP